MQLITSDNYNKFKDKNTSLAIGAFDGLHKGHQLIIKEALKTAKNKNLVSGVLSFEPHPLEIIPDKNPPPSIVSRRQKINLLDSLGVDYYFEQKFDQKFAELRAEVFVKEILLNKIKVNTVIVGSDFRFAYQNEGNVEILKKLAVINDFKAKIISQLHASDDRISSTRIRHLLKKGELKQAADLLGRNYQLCGKVIHGQKRGRKLGFPTANIKLESNYALPPEGVYAVKVHFDNKEYLGAANLGYNPTFSNQNISFEVYIIDFEAKLYGKRLCIDLIEYIRGEMEFSDKDDLIKQMKKDVLYTKEILC